MKKQDVWFVQKELGPMQNYVYFLGDPHTRKAAVIDPAWDQDEVEQTLESQGYTLEAMLITHGHPDHINLVEALAHKTQAKIYMNKNEIPWMGGWKETAIATDDQTVIEIGKLEISCMHTPGHTEGSQCFLFDQNIITGDTLFIDGCGRTDLPGGNSKKLYESLSGKIKNLPDQTIMYPGHNYAAHKHIDLGSQKKSNPYMSALTIDDFIAMRG
ncbi:MAG: MBL fold metallo-hydrolase [Bdellovibrionales bacterium]|nr:MBL fold metallo-hydrolase [Bdellovibrionales bacterium]